MCEAVNDQDSAESVDLTEQEEMFDIMLWGSSNQRQREHRKKTVSVITQGKVTDKRMLTQIYNRVTNRFDPMSVSDQKSLNNQTLLYDNMYFHDH